ncbi:nuclease-related domain-containing DEAD/DEAH box helicase [Ornithinimicrobium avium]|uniref:Nuclease n=1 Tax=Ornithinimicrobium avium TaxID=2283195 RepID=A0A345NP35_9MICO|nr:NERD domain-containing protein [Ornithinimicrobium avium]AXH96793.1 nuclease [Ornithinimicrobium avium]
MARMIPPIIGADSPPGETLIYQRLAEDPDCKDWIVLHSLHLAEVRRAAEGEIDFVIIMPGAGVLCLEVKSHRRAHRGPDGVWRLGSQPPTDKSPFAQAARGMHGVLDYLGRKRLDLRQVPVWSAVWFTHASADVPQSPEWHSWQLLDRHDLRRPISQSLGAVMHNARKHFAQKFSRFDVNSSEPSKELATALAAQLRPRFELSMTPKQVSKERAAERLSFVEEQYEALDLMEQEPRVLFTGPAGTGKSLLAAEAARRATARGERVLFVCFNRLLGGTMTAAFADLPTVTARTLHSYMIHTTKVSVPEAASQEWWQATLPELALEAALELSEPYDVLIVDEVQDVASNQAYLDVLDASLVGGLGSGRWLMFGDFEKQMLYGGGHDGRGELAARCSHFSKPTLSHNCRNTPQIGSAASRLSGMPMNAYRGYRRRDDGVRPIFRAYTSAIEQQQQLLAALDTLTSEHYGSSEIVILSAKTEDSAAAVLAENGSPRLAPYGNHGKKIPYTTIHAYKGLDAPAVVVTDIENAGDAAAQSLFYVALSRASDRLVVLADAKAMKELAGILVGRDE